MRKLWRRILPLVAALLVMVVMWALPALAEAASPDAQSQFVIDLTPFIQVAVTLLASLITIKVLPWIKARTTAQQQAALETVTRTIVYAAEQIYSGVGQGKQKLQYVQSRLLAKGYKVDVDAIEAAVREMNLYQPATADLVQDEIEVEDPEPPTGPDNPA